MTIGIYRMTRYPEHDFIVFQADDSTLSRMQRMFPLRFEPTKKGVEPGYWTPLWNQYRGLFDPLERFFHDNFQPPELRLSLFKGDRSMSTVWPAKLWKNKVHDAIAAHFRSLDYYVEEDESGRTVVLPSEPETVADVEIHRGVSFDVRLDDELIPWLCCDTKVSCWQNGYSASTEDLARSLGPGSEAMREIHGLCVRHMNQSFKWLKKFVGRISPLESCEGLRFSVQPSSPDEAALSTWFWLHDTETRLEGANGVRTNLASALLEKGGGLYKQVDDIQVALLLPASGDDALIPDLDCEAIERHVEDRLSRALPDADCPFLRADYSVDEENADLAEIKSFLDSAPERRLLTLMVAPPRTADCSEEEGLRRASHRSRSVERDIRRLARGGYSCTIGWDSLVSLQDRPHVLDNALIAGLFRLGAQPWVLSGKTGSDAEDPHAACFVGLVSSEDLGSLAGVAFDATGVLTAFGGCAEIADGSVREAFAALFAQLYRAHGQQAASAVEQIVLHLSPELSSLGLELANSLDNLEAWEAKLDALAIAKTCPLRILQPGNKQGTPSHGVAVGDKQKAFLMNTAPVAEQIGKGWAWPAARCISIRRLTGSMPMKSLAGQAFWLSLMNVNSLHRSVDLPVTLSYGHSLLRHIERTNRTMQTTVAEGQTLYWL